LILIISSHTAIYPNPEALGSRHHPKRMVYLDHLRSRRPITCEEPMEAFSIPLLIHQVVSPLQ